jgi:hypothetical protein
MYTKFDIYVFITITGPCIGCAGFELTTLVVTDMAHVVVNPNDHAITTTKAHRVRKDMDVNEHEKLSNFTPRHKFK